MVPPSAGHSAVHTNYFGCCEIAHGGLRFGLVWGFFFCLVGLYCFVFVLFFLSYKLKITAKIAAGVRIIYFYFYFCKSREWNIWRYITHGPR